MAGLSADEVYARHHRDVYRYLVRMTGHRDVADDLAQEVFLRVVRGLRDGGSIGHERGWVFSIARHLLVDRQREAQRRAPLAVAPGEQANDGTQELAFGLAESLQRLSEADRDTFLLREIGGFSYQEIAAVCESTVDAVRARLRRTRAALRATLSMSSPGKR